VDVGCRSSMMATTNAYTHCLAPDKGQQ
jgi:hypothetical protein